MMASMILFQRVTLSTVKLLRGINTFGEIWFESGHVTVSTPNFRCAPFPVLELQMAMDLEKKNVYYAMLQIINSQLHYASASAGFAQCKWRWTAAPALPWLWVSLTPVKLLWPPLHRQTLLENSSLLTQQCKENHKLQSFLFRFKIEIWNRSSYLNDQPTISLSSSATANTRRTRSFFVLSLSELPTSPERTCARMKDWTTSTIGAVNHLCSFRWTRLLCFSAKPARPQNHEQQGKEKRKNILVWDS